MLDQNGSRKCWINLFLKFDSFPFISAISLRYGEAKEGSTRDQVKRQAHVFRKQGKELSLYTLDIRKNLLEDLYENKYLCTHEVISPLCDLFMSARSNYCTKQSDVLKITFCRTNHAALADTNQEFGLASAT